MTGGSSLSFFLSPSIPLSSLPISESWHFCGTIFYIQKVGLLSRRHLLNKCSLNRWINESVKERLNKETIDSWWQKVMADPWPLIFSPNLEVRMRSLRSGLKLYWCYLQRQQEEGVDDHCPCALGTVRTLHIYISSSVLMPILWHCITSTLQMRDWRLRAVEFIALSHTAGPKTNILVYTLECCFFYTPIKCKEDLTLGSTQV